MRFGRIYRFIAGDENDGIEVVPPFQIEFDVNKTPSESPNVNRVRIYNLAPQTRKGLERPDLRCELHAGYAEESGPVLMLKGAIVDAYSYHDSGDVVTEIGIYDGWIELRDTALSISYGKGADAHTVIRAIARKMGLPLVMADSVPNVTWKSGFSYYGSAHSALHKACSAAGLEWSIQNQAIQVVKINGRTQREAIVLRAEGGLIGYPERTRRGAVEKARVQDQRTGDIVVIESAQQQKDGWRVRSLLLPQVNPGDTLILRSAEVDEICRADEVRHTGNFHDGDWVTDMLLVSDERYADA